MKLEKVFELIEELTHVDCKNKTIFELLGSTTEELGELSRELLIEEKSFGNNYKTVDEGSKAESIDLSICALAIFFARGGTKKEFIEIANKKLAKWKSNQVSDEQKKSNKKEEYQVICQPWLESERGWGVRPDGFSFHLSENDLKQYVKDYWAEMPAENPDEYSRPDGEPFKRTVKLSFYEKIVASKNGIRCYDKEFNEEKK